jgi:hypothetical protein
MTSLPHHHGGIIQLIKQPLISTHLVILVPNRGGFTNVPPLIIASTKWISSASTGGSEWFSRTRIRSVITLKTATLAAVPAVTAIFARLVRNTFKLAEPKVGLAIIGKHSAC